MVVGFPVVGCPWRRSGAAKGSSASSRARALVVLLLLAVLQPVAPAYAGGALIGADDRRLAVTREVSVIRWDGAQEQIVTRLTVAGDTPDAAWLMPVPSRATVRLGDPALLEQLTAATAPSYRTRRHFWPQDGDWPLTSGTGRGPEPPPPPARGPGVGVVANGRLGPFDVAHLSATDPAALASWLRTNGFALPAGLQDALQPYVALRWQYVAIKLAPAAAGALSGPLDPLHVTFDAKTPVYPMRLSSTPRSLSLYVLAAHRMEPVSPVGGSRPRVTFAGRVASDSAPLSTFSRQTPYVTVVAQEFPGTTVTADHELRRAATDAPVQQVVYADRLRTLAGVPAWLLAVTAAILALAATAIRVAVRVRGGPGGRTGRREQAPGDAPASAPQSATPFTIPAPSEGNTAPMTGTTEEPRPIGLTTRVTDALDALRARVRSASGDAGRPRAGVDGIPPMPTEAPTVGVPPRAGNGVPGGGVSGSGVSGVAEDWASEVQGAVPREEVFFGAESAYDVPPMPETAPTVGVPASPRVPPMPSTAPTVPPVPSYAPSAPAPAPDDGGTAHLFTSPVDVPHAAVPSGLHKYPFCAPPLNQNTFGTRQKHRRVSQVPRQGRGLG
ncbi:DUF2330 domain-containing protein [Streptomyces sp. NPDC004539]|uniref:DUF2330 domain-containing protein n=1 Tax=Streptomyces sp. NPDC004539 TaxID=3154280 RepID=UPI0033A8B747